MSDGPARNVVYSGRRSLERFSAYSGTLEAQRVAEHEHPEIQFVVGLGPDSIEASWHDDNGRRGRGILRSGEMAIIASGQPHAFAWRAPADVSCVYVDPRCLDEMRDAAGSPRSGAILSCYGLADPLARELVIALAREAADGLPSGRIYADALEQSLLLGAVRRGRTSMKPDRAPPQVPPRRLASVIDYVEHHFTEDIGLVDLAEAAGMSRFHFAHAFKAATGFTPCRFLRDRRIQEAKRLLETDLPLAAIAATLGFADQSHFAARFRAAVGVPPNAFRKAVSALDRKNGQERYART